MIASLLEKACVAARVYVAKRVYVVNHARVIEGCFRAVKVNIC